MTQYRKKPVVIEAFQMVKELRLDPGEWPDWLCEAGRKSRFDPGAMFLDPNDPERKQFCIRTLEGLLGVNWDDWIIQGVKGELYPCKPDIFEATYEEVL